MKPDEIKVTRCLGAALSDSDQFGWQVSYIERQFDTKIEAEAVANHLRHEPTPVELQAMREGRFVDVVRKPETRRYCPSCEAEVTSTDINAGYCTQCRKEL